ncbi:hypothetical protein INH39_24670 [Massilia violaceinigra]|uniref:Uncharacterized protein n=1 Tax=Massilia violaceinigra TaxID=2045208 RepID=A0ABY4A3J1_9BURK|nr:hypothetical protein [Massilia violaceinigra]UOD28614.1 hypothetical protein INH39_24670 [Massilia violaceinigra]
MKPAILLALTLGAMGAARADILITPSFIINIEEECPVEYRVCGKVSYTGTSKKTGQAIVLRGKTVEGKCEKDTSFCEFEGYIFKNGATVYRVTSDGKLTVSQGAKTLVTEKGVWQ